MQLLLILLIKRIDNVEFFFENFTSVSRENVFLSRKFIGNILSEFFKYVPNYKSIIIRKINLKKTIEIMLYPMHMCVPLI